MEVTEEKTVSTDAEMEVSEDVITPHDVPMDLDDPFNCLICLELVHKPVINACGHMFCFICIHRSMNSLAESYCPACRKQYMHFPRVCEQLHYFLLQAMPEEYRLRCEEVHAEELRTMYVSPQFDDGLQLCINTANSSTTSNSREQTSPEPSHSNGCEGGECLIIPTTDQPMAHSLDGVELDLVQTSSSEGRSGTWEVESASSSASTCALTCPTCKDMFFRPVALNCGHLFCEGCLGENVDTGHDSPLKCPSCNFPHPGPFPSVFWELHNYLEKTFPSKYEKRRREAATTAAESKKQDDNCKNKGHSNKQREVPNLTTQDVHFQVGCDGCGVFPLNGRRFKCRDCEEPIGYDLCMSCYETDTLIQGRFNQKHTREHRMVEVMLRVHPEADYFSEVEDIDELDESDMFDSVVTLMGRFPNWRSYPSNNPL